jgi:hypothetical protein
VRLKDIVRMVKRAEVKCRKAQIEALKEAYRTREVIDLAILEVTEKANCVKQQWKEKSK